MVVLLNYPLVSWFKIACTSTKTEILDICNYIFLTETPSLSLWACVMTSSWLMQRLYRTICTLRTQLQSHKGSKKVALILINYKIQSYATGAVSNWMISMLFLGIKQTFDQQNSHSERNVGSKCVLRCLTCLYATYVMQ